MARTMTAEEKRHWRRVDAAAGTIVAALALIALGALVILGDVRPLLAFLGVLVALDLPACGYVIWRGYREPTA